MDANVRLGASYVGAGIVGFILFGAAGWIAGVMAGMGPGDTGLSKGRALFTGLGFIVLVACVAKGVVTMARARSSRSSSPR